MARLKNELGAAIKEPYARFSITVGESLNFKLQEYAKRLHINRNSAVSALLSQALEQHDAIKCMNEELPKLIERFDELKLMAAKAKENETVTLEPVDFAP